MKSLSYFTLEEWFMVCKGPQDDGDRGRGPGGKEVAEQGMVDLGCGVGIRKVGEALLSGLFFILFYFIIFIVSNYK